MAPAAAGGELGGAVAGGVVRQPPLAGGGGAERVVDAALEDRELIGQQRAEVGNLALPPVRAGAQRRRRHFPLADVVPRHARQAREQAGRLADAVEHALRAHEVEDAPLLESALELLRERVDVDANRRRLHRPQRREQPLDAPRSSASARAPGR
jgi:hypothetical protein